VPEEIDILKVPEFCPALHHNTQNFFYKSIILPR
jgi:hypothetical protein